jgi:hypothetical protein
MMQSFLKQKCLFSKKEYRKVKQVLSGLWYRWRERGEDKGKGGGGEDDGNIM